MVVDELARRTNATFKGKFSGHIGEARVGQARVALLKPETFMNESGRSVQPAIAFYKTPLDAVLVVHDEVDLEHGRLQVRLGGGLAGHNGLRSIAGRLAARTSFASVSESAGPGGATRVMSPTSCWRRSHPRTMPDALIARAADAVESLLESGLEATQQRFNEKLE